MTMSVYPPASALILVAIMPAARDLEIARLLGWYRIPLKSAPKVIDVDYLAFYQTAAFGVGHRWCIEAVAEVRGHELTTRGELFRDQPDHERASEEYYKIQVGPVAYLPRAVQAEGWRRITFLYTTGALLQAAKTIGELVVRSEERQLLWRSLRERAMRGGQYRAGELPEIAIDPLLLAMLGDLGKIMK
jgi:hypothetical protein